MHLFIRTAPLIALVMLLCGDVAAKKPARRQIRAPSAHQLLNKIYLVHATRYAPDGRVIRAGVQPGKERSPIFRPTTHFAQGGLVLAHTGNQHSWEDHPMAVVMPMRSVRKQLVNILPQDTIALGDVRIPDGGVVVAAKGQKLKNLPKTIEVRRFDPKQTTLRAMVDKVIADKGGWKLDARGARAEDAVLLGKRNVNKRRFYRSLLKESSHITFELHDTTLFGAVDSRMIDLLGSFQRGIDIEKSLNETSLELMRLDTQLSRIDGQAKSMDLSKTARAGYERNRATTQQWINLLRAELYFQRRHKTTMLKGLKDVRADVPRHMHSIRSLIRLYRPHLARMSASPESDRRGILTYLSRYLTTYSARDAQAIASSYGQVLQAAGGKKTFSIYHALQRVREGRQRLTEPLIRRCKEQIMQLDAGKGGLLLSALLNVLPDPAKRSKVLDKALLDRVGTRFDVPTLLAHAGRGAVVEAGDTLYENHRHYRYDAKREFELLPLSDRALAKAARNLLRVNARQNREFRWLLNQTRKRSDALKALYPAGGDPAGERSSSIEPQVFRYGAFEDYNAAAAKRPRKTPYLVSIGAQIRNEQLDIVRLSAFDGGGDEFNLVRRGDWLFFEHEYRLHAHTDLKAAPAGPYGVRHSNTKAIRVDKKGNVVEVKDKLDYLLDAYPDKEVVITRTMSADEKATWDTAGASKSLGSARMQRGLRMKHKPLSFATAGFWTDSRFDWQTQIAISVSKDDIRRWVKAGKAFITPLGMRYFSGKQAHRQLLEGGIPLPFEFVSADPALHARLQQLHLRQWKSSRSGAYLQSAKPTNAPGVDGSR